MTKTAQATGENTMHNVSGSLVMDVTAGSYSYHYQPTIDFLHPYNGDTFIADIVQDPNAVKALTEGIPGAVDGALASVNDGAACNLMGAIFFTMVPDLPEKIDTVLRSVEYHR